MASIGMVGIGVLAVVCVCECRGARWWMDSPLDDDDDDEINTRLILTSTVLQLLYRSVCAVG